MTGAQHDWILYLTVRSRRGEDLDASSHAGHFSLCVRGGIGRGAGRLRRPAVGCGSVITEDTVLTRNVKDCATGLVVAGPVTLDLNGFSIKGTGTGTGVLFTGDASGATVTNGTIKGFSFGVGAFGGVGITLRRLNVTHNSTGISVSADQTLGENWHIVENHIHDNAGHGLTLVFVKHSEVRGNTIVDNGWNGALAILGQQSLFVGNKVSRNGLNGIYLQQSVNSVFENRLNRNGGAGLSIADDCGVRFLNLYRVGNNVANRNAGLGTR